MSARQSGYYVVVYANEYPAEVWTPNFLTANPSRYAAIAFYDAEKDLWFETGDDVGWTDYDMPLVKNAVRIPDEWIIKQVTG